VDCAATGKANKAASTGMRTNLRPNRNPNRNAEQQSQGKPSIATPSNLRFFFGKQRLVCYGCMKINYKSTALSSDKRRFF
jgi:hypothetical protein